MTWEEAIELKAAVGRLMYSYNKDIRDYNTLINFIESALSPVRREQVEKVWRGEWIKLSAYRGMEQYKCSKCGQEIYVPEFMGEPIYSFCPMCSSAMMDSSVDLMIDKLGEMKFE